jgi:hypothetical protein
VYHPQSLSKPTFSHHYLCGNRSRHIRTNLQRAETQPLILAERTIDSDPLLWIGLTSTTCPRRFSSVRGEQTPKVRSRLELYPSSKVEAKRVPRTSNCYFRSSKPHQIRDYESSERGRPCFSRCRATETRRDKRGNVHAGCQSRHARKCRQRWLYARRASCTLLDDAVGFPRLYRSRTGGHGTPENDSVRFLHQVSPFIL